MAVMVHGCMYIYCAYTQIVAHSGIGIGGLMGMSINQPGLGVSEALGTPQMEAAQHCLGHVGGFKCLCVVFPIRTCHDFYVQVPISSKTFRNVLGMSWNR